MLFKDATRALKTTTDQITQPEEEELETWPSGSIWKVNSDKTSCNTWNTYNKQRDAIKAISRGKDHIIKDRPEDAPKHTLLYERRKHAR